MRLTAATHAPTPAWVDTLASRIGVTRLADVTHLDYVGMPVFQAVRPTSRSYVVTQGKGLDDTQAKISAVVEAAELFCAERVEPDVRAPLCDVAARLRYDVYALPCTAPPRPYGGVVMDFVRAEAVAGGSGDLVPLSAFSTDYRVGDLPAASPFRRTTNGLGAGPTLDRAVLHGLFEVIERDALSRGASHPLAVEPTDEGIDRLAEAIAAAGLSLHLTWLEHPTQVPVVRADVHEPGTSVAFVGACAAATGSAAVRGAVIEALQSRLAFLTGTRDDLDDAHYAAFRRAGGMTAVPDRARVSIRDLPTVDDDAASLAARVTRTTGFAPLYVDIGRRELALAVVFVLAPGLAFSARLH